MRTLHIRAGLVSVAVLAMTAPMGSDAQTPPEGLFRPFEWRTIGPANMVGRITDIEAVESKPAVVYIATASGGIFKSENGGTTWAQIFERYGTSNMGDITIFQADPDIVWVGTGESCTRNSIGWGDGVYKSTDGGKTFVNVGLKDTHHISEVVTHPTNPDVVWVAAQGHLWGHTGERGIFQTTDGGRTWTRLTNGLPDDGRTGASDLAIDPANPDVLYAGFWERLRLPYRFLSGGPNGGLFKSTDGGRSWTRLTRGLPPGEIGKVEVAVSRTDPRVVVANIEHGFQPRQDDPAFADMSKLGSGIYRSEDGGATWRYVNRSNPRPFYYSHIWIDPSEPNRIYQLAENAMVSEDGGVTFDREFPGIEGDFHALWVDPNDSDHLYVGDDKGAAVSFDGGRTFILFDNIDAAQYYAISVDMRDPYWVFGGLQDNGSWGGPSNSRDFNGVLTDHWFKMHSGDGMHTANDPLDWRTVYTSSEGGNLRRIDALFRQISTSIRPNLRNVVNLAEVAPGLTGDGNLPRDRFRFNWKSPFILSPHDSRTIYLGGNHLFRSTDRGDTWRIISPDLSTGDTAFANPWSGGMTRDASGAETHASAISISESPLTPGVLWVGTDDGNVQLTRDGGLTWTNVRLNVQGVPQHRWVSRVEASHFDAATAYITFDGHRSDDFTPYVFRTTDWGKTWTNLAGGLPQGHPVYVIKEDAKNRNLLFVGTEFALFASIDRGTTWQRFMSGFPTVPVHDLVIHPRDNDLVAGTHGRGIWIADDITPLQQITPQVLASDAHLFENRVATKWHGISRGATRGHFLFMGRNPLSIEQRAPSNNAPDLVNSASITFYLKDAPRGPVTLEVASLDGQLRFTAQIQAEQGINRYRWNLRFPPPAAAAQAAAPGAGAGRGGRGGAAAGPLAAAGTYRVVLTVGALRREGTVTVREDPDVAAIGQD
ncbi:MAG: VPS10 domain-containing protein [Longimicrobiales bacterium]